MKNDKDVKKWKSTDGKDGYHDRDEHYNQNAYCKQHPYYIEDDNSDRDTPFMAGFTISCFFSTYLLQLGILLWDDILKLLEGTWFDTKKPSSIQDYIRQEISVSKLIEHNTELSVIDFLPIGPFIITLISSIFIGGLLIDLGIHRMKIFDRFDDRGAFVLGCASWFACVALVVATAYYLPGGYPGLMHLIVICLILSIWF